MIQIWEDTPRKLSGLTSFFVKFDFNQQVIDCLKGLQPAVYHKKDQIWEISSHNLTKLLDGLVFFDSIGLKLKDDEINKISNEPLSEDEINSFKQKPFNHQVEAINYGLTKCKWLNLDSMGLGKSLEAMYLAETLHNRGKLDHCLVICGVDSLRTNWKNEIRKFSKLDVCVLGEYQTKTGKFRYKSVKDRAEQLLDEIKEFFIVVNIASIRDDRIVEAFKKSKNNIGMIVFDECHRATKGSQQGSNLLKLDAEYKVAMSGTPIVNSPISAYLPLAWTENDHATLTNYKATYCEFGGFNNSQVIGYKNLDLLKEELDACSIRRTFDQVRGDMPLKTIEYEIVEMSDEHAKFYEAVKNGVKEEVDKVELKSSNLLALTTRLRQATADPSILTTENIESSKVERAVELAEDLLESGEKVVIFSTFVEPCNILATKLGRFHPLLGTGQQDDQEVIDNIEKFRNQPDFNLLIGSHGKIGTGFSMSECHYEIILDTPWTYSSLSQTIDRCYRITSDQPIYVKILCCADTIDERVRDIVENKKDLADYLVDGKENVYAQDVQDAMRDILLNL